MSDIISNYHNQFLKILNRNSNWQKETDADNNNEITYEEFQSYLEPLVDWSGIKSNRIEDFFDKLFGDETKEEEIKERSIKTFFFSYIDSNKDQEVYTATKEELDFFNTRFNIYKDLNNYNIGNLNIGQALLRDHFFKNSCADFSEDEIKGFINEYLKQAGINGISLEKEDGSIAEFNGDKSIFTSNTGLTTLQKQVANAKIYTHVAAKYLNLYIKYQTEFSKAVSDYVDNSVLNSLPVGSWENKTIDWASLSKGFTTSENKKELDELINSSTKIETPIPTVTPPSTSVTEPTETTDPTLFKSRADQVIYDFRNITSDDDTIAVEYKEEARYVRYFVDESGQVIFTDNASYDSTGGVFNDTQDNTLNEEMQNLKKQLEEAYAKEFEILGLEENAKKELFNKALFLVVSDWGIHQSTIVTESEIDIDTVINATVRTYETILFNLQNNQKAINWLNKAKDKNLLAGQTMAVNSFTDYYEDNSCLDSNNWVRPLSSWGENKETNDAGINTYKCSNVTDTKVLDNALTKLYDKYVEKYAGILDENEIKELFIRAQENAIESDLFSTETSYNNSKGDDCNVASTYGNYTSVQEILIETMFQMEQEISCKILGYNQSYTWVDTEITETTPYGGYYKDSSITTLETNITKSDYNYPTAIVQNKSEVIINNLNVSKDEGGLGFKNLGNVIPAFYVSNTGEVIFVNYEQTGSVFNDEKNDTLNEYMNNLQTALEEQYADDIKELELNETELENLFNLALFLSVSNPNIVTNQYKETLFRDIVKATIENYSKMLVEVGKGQAARAYLTDTENNSLLAGRYKGVADETEVKTGYNSELETKGLTRNMDGDLYIVENPLGNYELVDFAVTSHKERKYKESWQTGLGILSLGCRDSSKVDDAMFKLYKKYLNNYDGIISAEKIKELYIEAQRNAITKLVDTFYNDSVETADGVYAYSFDTEWKNGNYTCIATRESHSLSIASVIIQIMYEMERLLALEAFGL